MTGGWLCLVCATNTSSDTRGQSFATRGLCCRCKNSDIQVRWAPLYEEKKHVYVPDAMAMGDCRACGNVAESPQHERPKEVEKKGQLTLF